MASRLMCSTFFSSSSSFSSIMRLNSELTKAESVVAISRRWRKRRWAPISASKLFIVRERTPIDPEEYEDLKVRYAHYRTLVRSIREYFRKELFAKSAALMDEAHIEQEAKHFTWCLEENDRWNKESARFREARDKVFEKEKQELELKQLIEIEEQQQDRQRELRLQVLKTKEDAKKFISPDNLENMIEVALNQRSNHNFVIDTEGRRFVEQTDGSTVLRNFDDDSENDVHGNPEAESKSDLAENR